LGDDEEGLLSSIERFVTKQVKRAHVVLAEWLYPCPTLMLRACCFVHELFAMTFWKPIVSGTQNVYKQVSPLAFININFQTPMNPPTR